MMEMWHIRRRVLYGYGVMHMSKAPALHMVDLSYNGVRGRGVEGQDEG